MTKVLICEDDKFLANAYSIKLKSAGFEVDLATDGQEALDKLASSRPDILVLDLIMPKKDGFFVLEALKSSEQLKNLPVIVASNLGQKEDIEKAMNMGAKDYIIKSDMPLGGLIEKINAVLPSPKPSE